MEYLKNGSLEDKASGGYISLTLIKKIMCDVLRGLKFAHSKNIVHRDIKPSNILKSILNPEKDIISHYIFLHIFVHIHF